jgi:hypothetical protein
LLINRKSNFLTTGVIDMYKVKFDESINRVYITVTGILSFEEAQKAKQAIEESIMNIQPGFDVINDISKLIRADEKAGIILKEIIVLLIQKGVKRVVRVVGTSQMGLIQFANNSLQTDKYNLSYVPTLEDAEKLLNGPG